MNILITNDDGIDAKGIATLAEKFKEMGEVTVVAPNKQMSATSHSITTVTPIRVQKHYKNNEFWGYSLMGSPADCVKWALSTLLEKKPDMVVSGINHGRNTGINIMYSGTVAAAAEGHIVGIPSFAVSLSSHDSEIDCEVAAEYAFKIVSEMMKREDKEKLFLNINIPAVEKNKIKGIKVVKSSSSFWEDNFEKRIDPFGRAYYWFNGSYIYDANEANIDDVVLDDNYVAVTPIQYQFTNIQQLEEIKDLENITNLEEVAEENSEVNDDIVDENTVETEIEIKPEDAEQSEVFERADSEIERILSDRENE